MNLFQHSENLLLNPRQLEAVHTVQGRLLVLAGAGSGKTRVIVHRIAHLIDSLHVPPEAILGLTFTNKAAEEMRQRVKGLIGPEKAKKVTLSTFHSFCMQVLRRYIDRLGYTKTFSLYDERDLERLIKQLAKDLLGSEEVPSLGSTLVALQQASQKGLSEKEAEEMEWPDEFSREMHGRLQGMMRAYNAVSFDHLISLAIRLFTEHPDILDLYQERFRYLMIDEYQDTNHAQFRLAELLAAKYQNLCVVGDDDQSIYGWRGAVVKHILEFKADRTIRLEQNYRSTPAILEAANTVIQNNQSRHKKSLWSARDDSKAIEVAHMATDMEEAKWVIEQILQLKTQEKLAFRDIAILYRSNALSRQFELALMQASWNKDGQWVRGIPYEIYGGLEFSARSEIKDLLSYLRAISNPLDQEAILRIINVPRRGISDTAVDELTQMSRSEKLPLWHVMQEIALGKKGLTHHPRAMKGIASLVDLFESASRRFANPPLVEGLKWFIEAVNYKKAIEEETKEEKAQLFKWENAQEFVNTLAQFEQNAPSGENSLHHFVTQTLLYYQPSYETEKKRSADRVQLMTFHSAKGLEFPACFLVAIEDKILPHEKSMMQTGIEEERRLFYVALTRAERHLTLSMARSRLRMGTYTASSPSRFLMEIPKHVLKLTRVS